MKKLILLSVIFALSFGSYGQKKELEKAVVAYEYEQYGEAIDLYKVAYSKCKDNAKKAEIIYKIAVCYSHMNNPKSAELWFRKAIKVKYPDPLAVLYLADAKKKNGKFEDAIKEYKTYQKLVPSDKRGKIGIKSCEMASDWLASPTRYKVENIPLMNSPEDDFCPFFGKKDFRVVLFSSNRTSSKGAVINKATGKAFNDIYMTTRDRKGKWSTPNSIGEPVNTSDDEGASSLNLKGSSLYFTRCRVEKKKVMGCQIYFAQRRGASFGTPLMVDIKGSKDSLSVGHPAVTGDDLTLYFAGNLPGGYGGMDIWVVKREKKNKPWSEPINLGPEINTPGNEMFPYIRVNGELYFASDYHEGMGGLDIFKAQQDEKSNKWSIENMKSPINSPADDFGIVFEGEKEKGYLTSTRKGGKGGDDIYEFILPELQFTISGIVYNEYTKAPVVGATVKLIGSDGKNVTNEEILSEADGSYQFKLKVNTDYQISTTKEGFLKGKTSESTKGIEVDKDFKHDIPMAPIINTIKIDNVFYVYAKCDLKQESFVELDKLVETLKDNPTITIELSAHTDFRGTDASNDKLSHCRAENVVNYLISKGIDADRLEAKGYGETKPAVVDTAFAEKYEFLQPGDVLTESFIKKLSTVEEQEVAHQMNRRTEFRVLKTDYIPKPSMSGPGEGNKEEEIEEGIDE